MSPSRPFILRPVATSLLMVAVLIGGAVAYRQLPVSALPEVDYPTIQVTTFYPGASPEVMATSVTAAGTPVRADAGPEADDLDELVWELGDHAAVRPGVEHRRRRTGGPGGGQRERNIAPKRRAESAGVQQGEPGRRTGPDAGAQLRRAAAPRRAGARRHASCAEDRATARRRTGHDHRRAEARGPRAGESNRAGGLRRRTPPIDAGDRGGERQSGEGHLRRATSVVHHRTPTIG